MAALSFAPRPTSSYCKDTDGDGVADVRRVVFTGFGRSSVQGLLDSLRWGLDSRVHGAPSSSGWRRSYGHRRPPVGNQARVSGDNGRTWSEPEIVSRDDLGYPSTVELTDGTLLTVWYEALQDRPCAVLRQTTWRLE
jgi:hypothetical protein